MSPAVGSPTDTTSPPPDLARLEGIFTGQVALPGFPTAKVKPTTFTPDCDTGPCGGTVSSGGKFQTTADGYSFLFVGGWDNGIGITCIYLVRADMQVLRTTTGPSGEVATRLAGNFVGIDDSQNKGDGIACSPKEAIAGTTTLKKVG